MTESNSSPFICNFFFFFLVALVACEILIPLLGIQPVHPAVEAQSFNHYTAKESP